MEWNIVTENIIYLAETPFVNLLYLYHGRNFIVMSTILIGNNYKSYNVHCRQIAEKI